jgi:hypothetical protein
MFSRDKDGICCSDDRFWRSRSQSCCWLVRETHTAFTHEDATIIDDANTKTYDLFAARFVDLDNGVVYDSVTKLLWTKDTDSSFNGKMEDVVVGGVAGWRLPSREEISTMRDVVLGKIVHPFKLYKKDYYLIPGQACLLSQPCMSSRDKDGICCSDDRFWRSRSQSCFWPVRGGNREYTAFTAEDQKTSENSESMFGDKKKAKKAMKAMKVMQ